MKKSIAALAVLSAAISAAHAQSANVTIGGILQANIKSYKPSGATVARATAREMRIDDDYTSRFWLTGSEDLGGGLSAIFYVENRLNTDVPSNLGTGNGLGNGDTWLGLRGAWGQVTIGKHTWMGGAGLTAEALTASGITAMPSSMWATMSLMNQTGRSFVDYLDGGSRRANSVTYRSPNLSGFSATVGVSTAPAVNEGTCAVGAACAADYSEGREYFLQGSYNAGPLSANLAYRDFTAEGATSTRDKQWRAWGFYKLDAFKLGLIVDRANRQAAGVSVARTAWSLPVSYVMGKHTLMANYARAGDLGNVANSSANMWTLGWDYAFSRRTNLGVYYSRLSNESAAAYQPFAAGLNLTGSALAAGENASTLALGVKHTF